MIKTDTLERHLVYFPVREILTTPSTLGLSFEEIFFQTDSGRKLHGWSIPHPQSKGTLLFFHGNAGNISHRLDKIKIFYDLGLSTFIFDYAGFGKSEGSPSETALYEDGLAAFENRPQKEAPLILYGESLGTAVALEVAKQKKVEAIILESSFTSLKDLAKHHYFFMAPLAGNKFNNLEKIKTIQIPKLFIHSRQDEIVPFELGQALFDQAPPPKSNFWFTQGGHNDSFLRNLQDYQKALKTFIGL